LAEIPLSPTDASKGFANAPASPSPSEGEQSRRFRRPTVLQGKPSPPVTRGLYETQKLLAHLIDRLEQRSRPPDLLDRAASKSRLQHGHKNKTTTRGERIGHVIVSATQSGINIVQSLPSPTTSGIHSDDYGDRTHDDFDISQTYDLVEQLRALLVLAQKQELQLFGYTQFEPASPVVKAKRKGRLSSFAAPAVQVEPTASSPISGAALLERMVVLLRDLINVDCAYRIAALSPVCPPNALAAACLNIASFVFHHASPMLQITIVETVISGLWTMPSGMVERICAWLEGGLGVLLETLSRERGGSSSKTFTGQLDISL
jgi:hypothetical protein